MIVKQQMLMQTINAIVHIKKKEIHIILGGDDKGANLTPLFENIKELNITVYAIGTNSDKIANFCNQYKIKSRKLFIS